MQVKKVNSTNMRATYCCISAQSPYAEGLSESKEWFEANMNEHVEGYHLLDGEKVVGHMYFAMSGKALLPYDIELGVACIYCTYLLQDICTKALAE